MIEEHFAALRRTVGRMETDRAVMATLRRWGSHLAGVLQTGGRLLACGNGGSAAEAQHLTSEVTGRFRRDRPPYAALALHADTSAITAILNDYGPDEVFARQVRAHGRPGDVLVALSTSGRSANVLAAAANAHAMGLTTWALTGPQPNQLASICDDGICVPADEVATVQEVHLLLIHALCEVLDEALRARRPLGEEEPA
ncbi:D-sedoheptulose-7-phosphate isomerase [Thermasporomyces composti]|uniref:Phosphoheptose isomerase n=1 Tax=Thermasporomyces composti TaxID=696763 RepID=A0A3D9V877_THECX|nr:SIS domain-containing protein [Thermasporomyces composti]REF36913.1 phosphoheptose isomerase [Thermasporomyces composti]